MLNGKKCLIEFAVGTWNSFNSLFYALYTYRERKSLGNLQYIRACCGCLQGGDTRWRYSQIQRYVRTLLSGHRELTYFRSGWVIVKEFFMICFLKWNASTDALDDRWIWYTNERYSFISSSVFVCHNVTIVQYFSSMIDANDVLLGRKRGLDLITTWPKSSPNETQRMNESLFF